MFTFAWLRPNTIWRKLAFAVVPIGIFLWWLNNIIGAASNLEFAFRLLANPYVMAFYEFITSPHGQTVLIILGILWLSGLVLYQAKHIIVDKPVTPSFPLSLRFLNSPQFVRESEGKRTFCVGVADLPKDAGVKLKLNVRESHEWNFPLPSVNYTDDQGEGDVSPYGSILANTEIVVQDLATKEISFRVPCDFKGKDSGTSKSIWCELEAQNSAEPDRPLLTGKMTFWLYPDENGDLQMKPVSSTS